MALPHIAALLLALAVGPSTATRQLHVQIDGNGQKVQNFDWNPALFGKVSCRPIHSIGIDLGDQGTQLIQLAGSSYYLNPAGWIGRYQCRGLACCCGHHARAGALRCIRPPWMHSQL